MRRGRKRILALGLALAFLFGTMWGTGITPMHGLVAEVGGDAEPEDGEDYDAADTTEEEEPGEPDEETEAEDSLSGSLETNGDDTNPEAGVTGDGGAEDDPVETNAMTVGQEIEADGSADESEETAEQDAEGTEDALEIVADTAGSVDTEANADTGEAAKAVPEETAEVSTPEAPADTAGETAEVQAAMPEGSLSGTTAGGIHVSASYGENVFPEGTTMQVADLSKEDAIAKAADAVDGEVVDAAGADITFFDKQGNEVEPYEGGKVDVTLTLDTPLAEGELTVVHIDDAGNAEELAASDVDEVTETGASFAAAEFSEYVLAAASPQNNQKNLIKHVNTSYGGISIAFDLVLESPATLTYDGTEKKPTVENLEFGSRSCSAADYRYLNNINAGDATIYFTIKLNGSSMTVYATSFTIEPKSLNKDSAISLGRCTYDGSPQKPEPSVGSGGKTLTKGTDYRVSYSNNINADPTGSKPLVTVTGIGNYTGTVSVHFNIAQLSLANTSIKLSPSSYTWDGTAKEPAVTVSYNGKDLDSSNYTVSYSSNTGVGQASVTVKPNGSNCKDSKGANFTIEQASLAKASLSLNDYIHTPTGSAIEPPPIVKYNGTLLKEDTDYTVAYSDNTNEGTATVAVTGKGNYTGTLTQSFFIVADVNPESAVDLRTAIVTLSANSYTYDGTPKTPTVTVTMGGVTLTQGTDYRTEYFNNVNAGTAGVVIVPADGSQYKAGNTATFTIEPLNLDKYLTDDAMQIALEETIYWRDYTKKEPKVTVKYNNQEIPESDYTVSYTDNIYGEPGGGIATATITGNGTNCTGTASMPFCIYAEDDVQYAEITLSPTSFTYDGKEKKPNVTVKMDQTTLKENVDYTVSYSNNIKAGKATVTITGVGEYIGTKTATFTIKSSGGSGGSSSSGGSSGSSSASGSGSSSSSSSSSGSSSLAKTYKAGSKGTKADYIKLTKKSVRYDMCQASSKIKKAKVPDVVKIGKKTYKVTAVSTYAFLDCDKLTSITIGANVKKIGASAFSGCKGVKTLVIQSRLLTKAGVKNCLKGSSVETIIVPDGTEKAYAKLFAKENSGRGKAVKIRPASKAVKK